jgi:hypothetical protein
MGRKQRLLDPATGPVAEFAAQLRALRQAAGNPTFAAMSRRGHRSTSVLSEAAGGVELPTWPTVEAFLQACGHTDTAEWQDRWQQAQEALAHAPLPTPLSGAAVVPTATVLPAVPAFPPTPRSAPAAQADRPAPRRDNLDTPRSDPGLRPQGPRRRWIPARLRTLAALVVGLVVGLSVGTRLSTAHGPATTAATTPEPMPTVVVVPVPSPLPWRSTGSGCSVRSHWVYQYPQTYEGQVYILLSTPTGASTTVSTTITWGEWALHRSVTVDPGTPTQGAGGTLLLLDKLDTSLRDPLVEVDTATPVCAAFGTADGTSVAPLTTVDANQGWVSATPSPAQ